MRLSLKLCGVRRAQDAVLVAEAGADEVGVVFAKASKRRVRLTDAWAIRQALPPEVPLVGVFQDATLDDLRTVLAAVPLSALQLHGALPEGAAGLGVPLVAALQISSPASLQALGELEDYYRLLLDGPKAGSGHGFAWELARTVRPRYVGQVFIAGGLDPDNVAEAIAIARPDGVDVASGIEGEDGFKDRGRVRAFIDAAREAARLADQRA
jgi:phosphoribosylanthranilate isomerase